MRHYVLAAMTALFFAVAAQAADFTETKLTASDAGKGDLFGWSVAMSGPTAIVGAQWKDNKQGAAYLYDTATGVQIAKLTASDAVDNGRFGSSVAISGTMAIVGASGWDASVTVPGAVYVFDTTTGTQTATLTLKGVAAEDLSVNSVGISGSTAIVGAYTNDDGGEAYLFDTATGTQTLQQARRHSNSLPRMSPKGTISVVQLRFMALRPS